MRRLAVLLLPIALLGCSVEELAVDSMVPTFVKTKDGFNRETIPRYAREAAPGLIALINGLALASPENPELRILQAELNTSIAFAFLEREDKVWAASHYVKAQEAALIALADEDDELAEDLPKLKLEDLEARLAETDEDALPALFWWAFSRGAHINLDLNNTAMIADLGRVELVMNWVIERDETYFNCGPHMFFGMRYLATPPSLGGKPKEGLRHLRKVNQILEGKHLLAKVFEAQFYAPTLAGVSGKKATIEQMLADRQKAWDHWFNTLKAVVEAKADLWPEQALLNAVAKQRAVALLKDPEASNIIPPEGAKNPWVPQPGADDDDDGAWDDDDDDEKSGDDDDWGDGGDDDDDDSGKKKDGQGD